MAESNLRSYLTRVGEENFNIIKLYKKIVEKILQRLKILKASKIQRLVDKQARSLRFQEIPPFYIHSLIHMTSRVDIDT